MAKAGKIPRRARVSYFLRAVNDCPYRMWDELLPLQG